jgi:hypothetical protein
LLSAQTQQHRISLFQHMGQWARSAGMAAASARGALRRPGAWPRAVGLRGTSRAPRYPRAGRKKYFWLDVTSTVVVGDLCRQFASEREARAPLSFKVATKNTADLPTAEGSVLGGIQSCLCSGEVVLDETREAFLGFFEFGGVSESKGVRTKDQELKRHWPCSSILVQLAAVSPVLLPPEWWFEPATMEVGFPAALRA